MSCLRDPELSGLTEVAGINAYECLFLMDYYTAAIKLSAAVWSVSDHWCTCVQFTMKCK